MSALLKLTRKLAVWKPDAVARRVNQHYPTRHISSTAHRSRPGMAAVVAGATAATCLCSSSSPPTGCEQSHESSPLLLELFPTDRRNPLWPGGCRDEDVDAFVTQVLRDPTINIPGIPDAVERIIYKSTIRLVLNIFYWLLSKLHGFSLLDHQLVLERKDAPLVLGDWNDPSRVHVDEQVLQMVADRLLANAAVNHSLVPDAIERPLYLNSLRLVFRLLDILTASFSIKICGHVLLLDLVPLREEDDGDLGPKIHSLSSSLTRIDLDKVREVAQRHAGIVERNTSELSFLQRFFIREEFLAQLHASIYALILGIADDVLANAEINLLSDKIVLDVRPVMNDGKDNTVEWKGEVEKNDQDKYSSSGFDARSFVMGCGFGLTAAAAVLAAAKQGR